MSVGWTKLDNGDLLRGHDCIKIVIKDKIVTFYYYTKEQYKYIIGEEITKEQIADIIFNHANNVY